MAIVVAVVAAGALRAIAARKAQQQTASSARAERVVMDIAPGEVIALRARSLTQGIPISGAVRAVQSATIKARVAGELQGLSLREGDRVQAGQVVARIDTTETQARVRQAQQQADAARAQVAISQRQFDNNQALVAQGFISKTALDTSRASLDAAKASYQAAVAGADVARKSLADTVLKSPIDGMVAQRLVQNGERVAVEARILEVVDLSNLEVEALVPAAEATQVRVGQTATLALEGTQQSLQARVVRISPSAQAGLRAGADAHHARLQTLLRALQRQRGRLAHAHLGGLCGGHQGFHFQVRQIDHFENARFYCHTFAVLHQTLRHHAVNRALEDGVGQRLARHVGSGHGRLVTGFGGVQAGARGVERRFRNEALRHQRLVVVELPLADRHLRPRRVGLLLRLAYARLGFGGVNARHHLACLHAVAFAQAQTLQFPGDPRLDGGRLHGAHGPRDGNSLCERARAQRDDLAGGNIHHHAFGARAAGSLLLRLARRNRPQGARGDHGDDDGHGYPGNPTFHGVSVKER